MPDQATPPEVFISYASQDQSRVLPIVDRLEAARVNLWFDRTPTQPRDDKMVEQAIKTCKVVLVMCSDAAMQARNVKQELQLAWLHQRPYLPVVLERMSFSEQAETWLGNWPSVEVSASSPEEWGASLVDALRLAGVRVKGEDGQWLPPLPPSPQNYEVRGLGGKPKGPYLRPIRLLHGLEGLHALAQLTDRIWPVPAHSVSRGTIPGLRGLGAPQKHVRHIYRLGDTVRLVIEAERPAYLTLLNHGADNLVYCLCPSWFAPNPRLAPGTTVLPQPSGEYEAFEIGGGAGREYLLAILTDDPLNVNWLPDEVDAPARIMNHTDVDHLLGLVRNLPTSQWTVLATHFDVIE